MWSMEAWKRSGLGAVPGPGPGKAAGEGTMSSTLVETVSIPLDDFAESFLTCATCLCPYDTALRRPKLLGCSHTVCDDCLGRIAALSAGEEAAPSESEAREPPPPPGSLRCPICREDVRIPVGGVAAFPPSFLVNQLIDLMQRQRKDVVAKVRFLLLSSSAPMRCDGACSARGTQPRRCSSARPATASSAPSAATRAPATTATTTPSSRSGWGPA